MRANSCSAPTEAASTSGEGEATKMRVIWAGSSKITPMDRAETMALAVKQHFSMARTREYFPAPQLKPTAGCRESHMP